MDVLVVDDAEDIRTIVRATLEREGLRVLEAASGAEALEIARTRRVDLAILDQCLPDTTGIDLLTELRRGAPEILVLMLTGADREADRVLGLMSGADDYVGKPFSTRELAVRVIALGRRLVSAPSTALRFGDLSIWPSTRQVVLDGDVVEMPPREFDLLFFLASNPGRTFSREELLHAVWSSSATWQGVATVTEHIRRLRRRIDPDPLEPRRIVTVRGSGYRFDPLSSRSPLDALAESGVRARSDASVVIAGTTIAFATGAALALLGASSAEQLVGHDVFEFVAAASVEATRARHESAARGHWPRPEVIIIRRVDGSEVAVEIASAAVLWEGAPASQVTLWPVEAAASPSS